MKVQIKSTKKDKHYLRFTIGKEYNVIGMWFGKYPIVKNNNGLKCEILLNGCSHIKGDWEITEGDISEFKK